MVFTVEDRTKYRYKKMPLCIWGRGETFYLISLNGYIKFKDLAEFRKFSILIENNYVGILKGYYRNFRNGSFSITEKGNGYQIQYKKNKLIIPRGFLEDFMYICRRFSRNWWSYYLDNKGFSEIYI